MESTVLPPILPAKSTGGGVVPVQDNYQNATPGITQNSVMSNNEEDGVGVAATAEASR